MANKCPTCHSNNPDTLKFCGECGTQLPPPQNCPPVVTETLQMPVHELTTGSTLAGRYQVIEELGHGGMGRVYKVYDNDVMEKIALKLLKPEIAFDRETIERFSNELKLARKISHRNVCRMFDLGRAGGTTFITMEYVPGQDLKRLIRQTGPLGTGRAISIAEQLCEGLAEAHRLGVIHRDLKPQNIMVDEDGNARIMDFGIARSLRGKAITGAGVMIGTPDYMSPEQVDGKDVDQRSDIYSLGIILYEMLTGRVPFEGDSAFAIGVKHKSEVPRDPRGLNPQIPPDLGRLILGCLEKDKDKRPQSVEDVRAELERIDKGLPRTQRAVPKARPATAKTITVQLTARKAIGSALAVLGLFALAFVGWRLLRPKAAPVPVLGKPSLAVMYFKNSTGDLAFDIWRSGLAESVITDLAQSKYVNVLTADALFSLLKKLDLLAASDYATEDLKKVAAEGRATHVLLGRLSRAGDTFRVEYTLQDLAKGAVVGAGRFERTGEASLFAMVDELTRKVKSDLHLSASAIAGDFDEGIGAITTSSPEAYKLYVEGRRLFNEGNYGNAISVMEKAVDIDPEFAMAHRSMAMAYYNLGYPVKSKEYLEKALQHSDRLSTAQKFLIQAGYYSFSEKTYLNAIEAYEKLVETYSDMKFKANLAFLYARIGEIDKAIKLNETYIREDGSRTFLAYAELMDRYVEKSWFEKALEAGREYIRDVSDGAPMRLSIARIYQIMGQLDLASAELDKAEVLDPLNADNSAVRGYQLILQGDFQSAEEEFLKNLGAEADIVRKNATGNLCVLYIAQGRFKKALEVCEQRLALAEKTGESSWAEWAYLYMSDALRAFGDLPGALKYAEEALKVAKALDDPGDLRSGLWTKGVAQAEMNDIPGAQKTAEELQKSLEGSPIKDTTYPVLLARIELARGNYKAAVAAAEKSLSMWPPSDPRIPAHYYEPLARAYFEKGDLDAARSVHEKILALTTGRFDCGDVYARSFYMLGIIAEKKGDKAAAIERYDKFLDLWKDADPGIPEVEVAKKRRAGLKGN